MATDPALLAPYDWLQFCRHRLNCDTSLGMSGRLNREAMDRAATWVAARDWAAFEALDAAWSRLSPKPNPSLSDVRLLVYRVFKEARDLCLQHDDAELALLQRQPHWVRHLYEHPDKLDADLLVHAALRPIAAGSVISALSHVVPRTVHPRVLARLLTQTEYSPEQAFHALVRLHDHLRPKESLTRWAMRTMVRNTLRKRPWSSHEVWVSFEQALDVIPGDAWRELNAQRKAALVKNPQAFFTFCDTHLCHAPLPLQQAWLTREGAHLPQTQARVRQSLLAQQPPTPSLRPRRRA